MLVRSIGGAPTAVCTRCAGSVILRIGGTHGALVKPLPDRTRARPRDRDGHYAGRHRGRRRTAA